MPAGAKGRSVGAGLLVAALLPVSGRLAALWGTARWDLPAGNQLLAFFNDGALLRATSSAPVVWSGQGQPPRLLRAEGSCGVNRQTAQSIYDGSTLLGTAVANGSGNWSFSVASALSNGSHNISARVIDGNGQEQAAVRANPFPEGASGIQELIVDVG